MNLLNPSQLLRERGVPHVIGGRELNFKLNQGETGYAESLDKLLDIIQIKPKHIYHSEQVHGNHVKVITKVKQNDTLFAGYPLVKETDGFVTNEQETALLVRMADCTPVILYDPNHHAIGVVHSGWRSTVSQISDHAIKKMKEYYGTRAEDLVVYIGPCIDQDNYEVGTDVYDAFSRIGNREDYFKPFGEKYLMDIAKANIEILKQAGVRLKKIEYSKISTFRNEGLHSARRDGTKYQLNALMVYLPKKRSKRDGI